MKIPTQIAGLLVTAIGGGVAIAGEVGLSHPLHQTVVTAAALLTGLVGYFALPAGSRAAITGPPYPIPAPLPVPAPSASNALTAEQIDARAAAAREQGLP